MKRGLSARQKCVGFFWKPREKLERDSARLPVCGLSQPKVKSEVAWWNSSRSLSFGMRTCLPLKQVATLSHMKKPNLRPVPCVFKSSISAIGGRTVVLDCT